MRNKDTLTAAFSLACLEIRSRNEEGINLDCRAVPLQSVESKLGRTAESEMAERETAESPQLLVFYFRSHRSISSLA